MAERTAEDWGRIAVSLPGWRWMPGMMTDKGRVREAEEQDDGTWVVWLGARLDFIVDSQLTLDPDDPATTGCLLALLGPQWSVWSFNGEVAVTYREHQTYFSTTLGRACIAAAEALGRWPGGAE